MNFKGIRFRFISPDELKMPAELVAELRAKGFEVEETTADLNRALDVMFCPTHVFNKSAFKRGRLFKVQGRVRFDSEFFGAS